MERIYYICVIGTLLLEAEETGLCRVEFCRPEEKWEKEMACYVQEGFDPVPSLPGSRIRRPAFPILAESCRQLDEYFSGNRKNFTVPLLTKGTEFQKQVWDALRRIPYGQTRSYGQIAAQIGRPKAARAVGMGCNRNPLLLFIPCHRVVGSTGALTGFGCGLPMKAQLLMMEEFFSKEEKTE